ncbi:hypothetical protein HS088_TW01G00648 [Tripterygium wilfordii]|uniref:Uncharacterized protein n=1 Tax=Tripterygium wilfordii TaxID=458696 RepID=A0A7J7E2G9_TRIWF|nr:hypothetical protein HS088_TW01G00648 [Tripterygium wilfordii]
MNIFLGRLLLGRDDKVEGLVREGALRTIVRVLLRMNRLARHHFVADICHLR